MNVEIGAEATQFPEKEYINRIAIAVQLWGEPVCTAYLSGVPVCNTYQGENQCAVPTCEQYQSEVPTYVEYQCAETTYMEYHVKYQPMWSSSVQNLPNWSTSVQYLPMWSTSGQYLQMGYQYAGTLTLLNTFVVPTYKKYQCPVHTLWGAQICKRLRSPGIDSASRCSPSLVQPGGLVRPIWLSYGPTRLGIDSYAPLKVYKYGFSIYLCAGPGQEESEHHPVYLGVPESGQRIQRGGEGQNLLQGNCKISHILIFKDNRREP